jgi:hypothetical protein
VTADTNETDASPGNLSKITLSALALLGFLAA